MSFVQTLFGKRQSHKINPLTKAAGGTSAGRTQESSHRRFSALIEFGTHFNGVDDVAPVMEQTLRTAVKELEADLGYIMLLNPAEQTLSTEIAVSIGAEREFPETRHTYEGVEGSVAQSCQPMMLTRSEKTDGGAGNTFQFDGEALLCVPLIKQRKDGTDPKVCGTLTVIRERRKKAFRPADEAVARSLAALATVAIANAEQYKTLRSSFVRSLQVMAAAVEAKVPYMEGHAYRVGEVCQAIGERLQVDADVLTDLRDGALLHEIGKVGIPDAILLKPSQLTPEEFACLKQYPVIGYEMCRPLGLGDQILTLIRNHPERLDGTGYPDRLKYGELPLPLRILCVADAFDAMSSYRPYRNIMDTRARHEQLNRFAGTQFDPIVVETLKALLADGKIEDLYQEHWDKHSSDGPSPNPVPVSLPSATASVYLIPEDTDLETPAPIMAHGFGLPEHLLADSDAKSDLASLAVGTIDTPRQSDTWEDDAPPTMYLTGEPATDVPAGLALNIQHFAAVDSIPFREGPGLGQDDGVTMTLEEAALEAAAFAAAAMEAVRDENSLDKAA